MGRAEARDLNLFGGTLFEPGVSRPPASGPMLMEMNSALLPNGTIEFVPLPEEGRLPPTSEEGEPVGTSPPAQIDAATQRCRAWDFFNLVRHAPRTIRCI